MTILIQQTRKFVFPVRSRLGKTTTRGYRNARSFFAFNFPYDMIKRAMKTKISLFAVFLFGLLSFCSAAEVPTGIKNDAYGRLLQKYVNAHGLVAYEKWKNNAEDVKTLDDYLAQFAPSGNAARGNERYASLVNAYNALVLQWILTNYPTESIWALKGSFKEKRHKLGGRRCRLTTSRTICCVRNLAGAHTPYSFAQRGAVRRYNNRLTTRVRSMIKLRTRIAPGWDAPISMNS